MARSTPDSQMLRRFADAQVSDLSEYEIDVTLCTRTDTALDGDIWIMEGIDLSRYLMHPIVLWDHDMSQPIGRASQIKVTPEKITARVTFPPAGVSPKADEIRGMVKAGIITGVSTGIHPTISVPIDRNNPRDGNRITESILLEFSIVAVPCDATSGVTARAKGGISMANRSTETENELDQAAAEAAAAEAEVTASAAAEQRASPRQRGKRNTIVFKRGLYSVAQLCYLFEEIGYQTDRAKQEAAVEGDNSKVPGMLAAMLHDLGDILLAMTAEEVAEALAGHDIEPDDDGDDDGLTVDERSIIANAKTPAVRAFRRGLAHAKLRAGKKLSADSIKVLKAAKDLHEEAISDTRGAIVKHKKALGTINDLIEGNGDDAAPDADPETATEDDAAAERSRRARALQAKSRAQTRAA